MSGVTADYRPDTGLTNGRLGTYLFLAADAMFLGALLSSHVFLRTAAGESWPKGYEHLPWLHGGAAAILLIVAGILCSPKRKANGPWLAAFLAVVAAMAMLWGEYAVASAGFKASTDNFYGLYFLLTLVFRVQLLAIAMVSAWTGLNYARLPESVFLNRAACLGTTWRFLAAAWVVTFVLVYVL